VQRLAAGTHGGIAPSADVLSDMQTAGFHLARVSRRVLTAIAADEDVAPYKTNLVSDTLPVRKTLLDWLLFRGQAKVRRRLFGDDGTREIAPEEKTRRARGGNPRDF
jgi:hypothetical protein